MNLCLERDIAKKENFQIISNNGKRFNVKLLRKGTDPLKNESA